jgi:6-phosphogluconolactonase (cycloisomerase 2 family)
MRLKATILALAFLFFISTGLVIAERQDLPGAVYTMTNSDQGNEVLVFSRSADGSLTPAGAFATNGLGTGGGLGNQGGLILTPDNRWLFVVNAGSDTISVFNVKPDDLVFIGAFDSGGTRPVSLTVDGDLLYVLNAGGAVGAEDNITGFMIEPDGVLEPLAGSTQPLSDPDIDTAPAQIEFSTDGNVLVVTEKSTSIIDTYVVDDDGLAGPPNVFVSAGTVPFGFSFGKRNRLYVSEAGTNSASSYQVYPDGRLEVISAAVPTGQDGVCWLVITKNGRYAYTTNAGTGTISGFNIDRDGTISLLDGDGVTAEAIGGVIDEALSNNSRYLYALSSGARTILGFQVGSDGGLTLVEEIDLQTGANGLAAH